MNAMYRVALMVIVLALLATSVPLRASEMDDKIESSARKSYVFQTFLKSDDINIQSKDGVVTLTGTVSEEAHKSLAQEIVANIPGVKSVDNKLEVKGERPAEYSDAWLGAKVKAALLFHRNVSAYKTEVSVKDGIATLRGEAASEAQKELTTEFAKGVEGVKDVRNELTVSKSPEKTRKTASEEIDDASITAQVKMSLLYHRSTSALGTRVNTNNGVVTLSGKARNAAEKDLVTKLVSDINGVKSVRNEMTIEESKSPTK